MTAYFSAGASGPFAALCADGKVLHLEQGAEREDVLALFDRALKKIRKAPAAVSGIVIDRGPGVFSRVRHRVTVAVSLAYALDVPTAAVSRLAPEEAARLEAGAFAKRLAVEPLYDRPPNITAPKRKRGVSL